MTSDADLAAIRDAPRVWWRCPAAVVASHAQRTFFGMAIAWPFARWVGGRVEGRAGADATLFSDGGLLFAELLRQLGDVARPLAGGGLVVALIGFVVAHAATAGLIDAMARPRAVGLRARIGAACGPVPLLATISLVSLLLGAALFGLVWWSGRSIARAALEAPAPRDMAMIGVALLGLGAASWVGVLRDLVFVGVAGRGLGFFASLDVAWRTFNARAFGLWLQHVVRSAGAGVAGLAASLLALRIGMHGRRDAMLAQLGLEAALVAVTCLRASWLGVVVDAVAARVDPSAAPVIGGSAPEDATDPV